MVKILNSIDLASYIDSTILKPDITLEEIKNLCAEAIENKFAAVCIPPYFVKSASQLLKSSGIKVATVIGFPMGYSSTESKIIEAQNALSDGAEELDMVINIAAFKEKNYDIVSKEIKAIADLVHSENKILKVIIESGILNDNEIKNACEIAEKSNADFLKTSTGYASIGATTQAVKIMRSTLPANIKIKASGGIRDYEFASQLIHAGADRIGTSSGKKIISP